MARDAVDQSQHDGAKGVLQLCLEEQLLQYLARVGIALELQNDAHAVPIALIAQVREPDQLPVADQPHDRLDHPLLTYLVGKFADHQGWFTVGARLDVGARPHHDAAAAGAVGLLDAIAAPDVGAGREIGAADDLQQFLHRRVRPSQELLGRRRHLPQVVWRHLRRHADGDSIAAVHQQLWVGCRQHLGLVQPAVEVRPEVDGVLVDIAQEIGGEACQPRLGVAVGGGGVAVDRSEVALAVDQWAAHRERLRHPYQRVIHGHIPVRVILAQDVTDDGGGFLVGPLGGKPQLVHRVQDTSLGGLQTVARVGQCALHDHAHRIVDERLSQLFFQEALDDALAARILDLDHDPTPLPPRRSARRYPEKTIINLSAVPSSLKR